MRSGLRIIALLGLEILIAWHGMEAQARSEVDVGGYLKYMFGYVSPVSGGGYADHLLHARLNTAWHPLDELTGTLELRFRAFEGETVERSPDFVAGIRNTSLSGNLDHAFWKGSQSLGFGEVDRLSVAWSPPGASVSLGRQRIAWGTNLVWNPIDVFNPLSVLEFDYEERPPVDGVRAQWYTGELSKVEGAVKAGRTADQRIVAAMWSSNVRGYDFRFLGGQRGGTWFAGCAWAGDILGGGFRGEMIDAEGGNISGALSGDYTFPSSLYLHTELLYNRDGVRSGAGEFRVRAVQLGLLSPARFSVYQEIAADVTPLIRGTFFVILNPYDHSSVLVPSVSWNAAENFDVLGLLILARGAGGTEYGEYGKLVFVRLRYSF
jgi:hypothetical protein